MHPVRLALSALAIGLGGIAAIALSSLGRGAPAMWSAGLMALGFLTLLGGWKAAVVGAAGIGYFLMPFTRIEWFDTLAGGALKALMMPALIFGAASLIGSKKAGAPEDDEKPKAPLPEAGPRRSLTVEAAWDTQYQLFRGREALYVVRLNPFPEPEVRLQIDSEEAFRPSRGNAAIPLGDILEVCANPGKVHRPSLRIRTRGRRWRFRPAQYTSQEELEAFFKGLPLHTVETGLRSHENLPEPTEEQRARFEPCRRISIALGILGGLCAALWLLVEGASAPLAAANLALLAAAFALYCISFGTAQPIKPDKRSSYALLTWFFPALVLYFRARYDYNIVNSAQIAPPAAAIGLIFAALLLLILWKKKPELNRVLAALLCVAVLSPLAAIHLNGLLDDGSRRMSFETVVLSKQVRRNPTSFTEFVLVMVADAKTQAMRASRELYDAVEEDDTVTFVYQTGALGIRYSYVQQAPR